MYKIILDSCADFENNMELIDNTVFKKIPLTISIDGEEFTDDSGFNQQQFLKKMKLSESCPKSSCPAVAEYLDAYDCDAQDIYVVTLSAELSGSYNSAFQAKNLYLEEHQKNIHVFNSKTASVGEVLIAYKIRELAESGMCFQDVVAAVTEYISQMHTLFVLEDLDVLRKNGRLSGLQAVLTSTFNIKPIMGSTKEGQICKESQAIGVKRALLKMVEIIEKRVKYSHDKILGIAHCNCIDRAMYVKNEIMKRCKFKNIIISETGGISTMYANDGGVIVAY